jgi:hypothetical protein
MAEEGNFEALTNALGVPGTSYKMQLGLINEKWASRLIKGKNVLATKTYDLTEDEEYPNTNFIVGFVLQNAAIPNINPRQIMRVTESLLSRAKEKYDKKEIKEIESKVKATTPKEPSPKKDEELSEEEKRKRFQEKVKAKQQHKEAITSSKRELPSIPSAETETKSQSQTPTKTEAPAPSEEEGRHGGHKFCPYCGKDLDWKYCPYCGKKL